MKVIFLDIDGVLNDRHSRSRCSGFLGIDNEKVKRLREIVDATGAKIVLCSSWKSGWECDNKSEQDELANYLDRKLKREGLRIIDKTTDTLRDRGTGIKNWLESKDISSWIVLDDDVFKDYAECNIMPRLVKTSFYDDLGGLQQIHVQQAIEMLLK